MVYAHLLKEDTPPHDARTGNIEKIIKESTRCKSMAKRLLDYARWNEPVFEPVNIVLVIQEAMGNLKPCFAEASVSVLEHLPDNLPLIPANPSQLQEVCENLLRNAAESMESGERIDISGSVFANNQGIEHVELQFADTGPGITADNLAHIFDPFFTTKRRGRGNGLGLAMCANILKHHGGTIRADNRAEGGAVFVVQLPVGA